MAKFVCDFDQVITASSKLCDYAAELESAVNSYVSNFDSALASWNGEAKSTLSTYCAEQAKASQEKVQHMQQVGEFMKSAVQNIQNLEAELSAFDV